MRTQLETIGDEQNHSFSMMVNPNLSDLYYWHYHPEYELVYIYAEEGTRHVGNHKSIYRSSDLVLIGSNIPHLNFDYGLKSDYKKVVIHFTKTFVDEGIGAVPELGIIANLFEEANMVWLLAMLLSNSWAIVYFSCNICRPLKNI